MIKGGGGLKWNHVYPTRIPPARPHELPCCMYETHHFMCDGPEVSIFPAIFTGGACSTELC